MRHSLRIGVSLVPLLHANGLVLLRALHQLDDFVYDSRLRATLTMTIVAFGLNVCWYFVESRSRRKLASLFGTYVPPELVDEMVKDPGSYSMKASSMERVGAHPLRRQITPIWQSRRPWRWPTRLTASIRNTGQGPLQRQRAGGDDFPTTCICGSAIPGAMSELKTWGTFMKAYRAQDWNQSDVLLLNLLRANAKKYLYQLYAQRVASM